MSGAAKRPQLTIEELQQLKWFLGGLLTLIGLSTIFYMDVDAWTLMVVTSAATIAAMIWPTLPGRVPSFVHTLAFPAIVAFFVADLWLKTEVLPAMVRLDMLLLLYRNITYRQRRDDLQVIVLGLFLVVVAGVLTVSLTFAFQLLIYTACALALLLVVTLADALQGPAGRVVLPPSAQPAWTQHAEWAPLFRRLRAVTDWRVVGLGTVLFAGVVGVSALLFLAIPRFQLENSMFLDRFITKKARSGFSDVIRFGDVTEIQQDNSLALSVDVSDQSEIPASPYWRMLVLNQYAEGTFRMSPMMIRREFMGDRTGTFQGGYARMRTGAAVHWTFYMESGVSRYLPLLGPFNRLTFRETQNFRYAPRLAILALNGEPVSMTAYRVEGFELGTSIPDDRFAREWSGAKPEDRALDIQVRLSVPPGDRPKLLQGIAEATGGEEVPAPEFGRRVSAWLKKNHNYSLSPVIPRGDGDPLVRWLMSKEAGHCELFAGSFVLLARAAGFPARVVTGFRGGTWNAYSNNFTIRNADAHAWSEIFDVASGAWLRVDPLAPATSGQAEEIRGEAAIVSRMDRSWKARLDSLRVFWYRRIVSFDRQSQADTFKALKQATENSGKRFRAAVADFAARVRAWLSSPWDLERGIKVAFTAILAGSIIVWWRTIGRRWWRDRVRVRGRGGEDPVRREAGRWLLRLQEAGVDERHEPEVRAELQRVRFGARRTWTDPDKVFRRARGALREARRRERATRS